MTLQSGACAPISSKFPACLLRSMLWEACASGTKHCRLSRTKLDCYGRNRVGAFVYVPKSDFGCCGRLFRALRKAEARPAGSLCRGRQPRRKMMDALSALGTNEPNTVIRGGVRVRLLSVDRATASSRGALLRLFCKRPERPDSLVLEDAARSARYSTSRHPQARPSIRACR